MPKYRRALKDEEIVMFLRDFYIQRAHKLQKALSDEDELLGYLKSMFMCIKCYRKTQRCLDHLVEISRTAETVIAQCSFSTSVHEPAPKKSRVQIQSSSKGASPAVAVSHRIYKVYIAR